MNISMKIMGKTGRMLRLVSNNDIETLADSNFKAAIPRSSSQNQHLKDL